MISPSRFLRPCRDQHEYLMPVNRGNKHDPDEITLSLSVSIIILNFNGARWLERCFRSIEQLTNFDSVEIITVDNCSKDGSDQYAEQAMNGMRNGLFIQNGRNLGFCEGNNRGAEHATGEFLFFLNNDTWLEKDCLEKLIKHVRAENANSAMPVLLNYDDDSLQSAGAAGLDIFGLMSSGKLYDNPREIFVASGCSFLIRRKDFIRLGGFDPQFFMYAEEFDLSWRNWIAGGLTILVPAAKLHHWGAASLNPESASEKTVVKSTYQKRYYSNRNNFLVLLKNGQHIFLLLCVTQFLLLMFESLIALLLFRRLEFIQKSYLDAIRGCWKLRAHVLVERKKIGSLRTRSDWKVLKFLRLRPNRWDELLKVIRHGFPKIVSR